MRNRQSTTNTNNLLFSKAFTCLLFTVYCLFLFSSCGNNSSDKTEIKSAGQSLYELNCTSCHGTDGKLSVLGAKDLSVSAMPKDQMTEIITHGKNTMTPFGSVLNKEEVSEVADYVLTLRSK